MALRYDFDMFSIMPETVQDKFSSEFDKLGLTGMMSEQKAMFRDPNTVEALRTADQVVQDYFLASGFGLNTYDSGAPAGRFPAKDEEARAEIIDNLTKNLQSHDLKGANFGGFNFSDFLTSIGEANPITMPSKSAAPDAPARARPSGLTNEEATDLAMARMASQRQKGLRMIAFGGLLLGLILIFYVAGQML
ncbi:MAG: hypothetical protein AAFU41_17740 [Pseudomonadota bacterium]